MLATLIDCLGGSLLYPIFDLDITRRVNVGMVEVCILFALFAVSSFIKSMIGEALTDRFERKWILIFSLVAHPAF